MKKHNKKIVMMASIIMIIAATVAGTLAWLYTNTDTVTNTFTPAQVGNTVQPDTSVSNTKEGVDDNELVNAYIRATYTVNWRADVTVDDAVKQLLIPATPNEYTVTFDSSKWVKYGDYYYYTEVVAPGAQNATECLIETVAVNAGVTVPTSELYDDAQFQLVTEIVSQSVQADGVTATGIPAVVDAWKVVTVNADGTLNVPQNP